MPIFQWIAGHWLDLLQSISIVASLAFTAISLRTDIKVQRVSNLLVLTKEHRAIWSRLYERQELARVVDANANLNEKPITTEEELFVRFLILHLSAAQEAVKQGMYVAPDALNNDIRRFFSRPIPKVVWERTKAFQDADFAAFVEACVSSDKSESNSV